MIDPTATYVDKPLSNQITEWRPGGMVADRIFTITPVAQQGGGFYRWERADRFRLPTSTLRAPGTEPRKVEFRINTDTYFCPNYALGGEWTREELANSDLRERYRSGKAQGVKDALMLDYEFRVAARVTNTSNVGSFATPASLWSDAVDGNSDPIGDIQTYTESMRLATGYEPNACVLGRDVFKALVNHASIRNRLLPHGTGGEIRESALAQLFGFEELHIGGALYNSAVDDNTGFTLTQVWGGQMLLYYKTGRAGIDSPEYAKSFRWREEGFPEFQVTVHEWNTKARAQEFDVGYYGDEKITYSDLSFLVQSPIA